MKRVLFLAVTAMAVCTGSSAQAGFEWVPPTKASEPAPVFAQAIPSEPTMAAPTSSGSDVDTSMTAASTNIVPMPPEPMNGGPSNAPVADTDSVSDRVETAPARMANSAPRELMPDPLARPVTPSKMPSDTVEGFGRDIPLTIATRQIVPSDYTVQYGRGVDPSMAVSWSGGRSWKLALADALAEKNLKATIVADSIMIEDLSPEQKLAAEPMPVPVTPAPQEQPAQLEPVEEVTVTRTGGMETAMAPMPQQPMPAMPPVMTDATPANAMSAAPQVWVAPQAATLRQVLSDWCKESGVQLQWSAQYDYPLMSEAQINGSFEEAVETLLDGLVDAQPRPVARLHPNEPNGPPILVVETRQILE